MKKVDKFHLSESVGPNSQFVCQFYQIKFRNVCEVKKRLVQSGLVWSSTLSILLSMNGESVSLFVFA